MDKTTRGTLSSMTKRLNCLKGISLSVLLFFVITLKAQSSSEIYKQLKKLNFLGSVLYLAAHPDDENTRVISYFSNHVLARTAYLSMTRGDGGQNLIGAELREALGLIRTQELLRPEELTVDHSFLPWPMILDIPKTPTKPFPFGIENKFWLKPKPEFKNSSPTLSSTALTAKVRAEPTATTLPQP